MSKNDPIATSVMYAGLREPSGPTQAAFYRSLMGQVLRKLALNRIEWTGLPDEVPGSLIERYMMDGHTLALYAPPEYGKPILFTATGVGTPNNMGVSTHWNLTSINNLVTIPNVPYGRVAVLDPWRDRAPVRDIITYYAELFNSFDEALKSNLRVQKTPVIIVTPENLKLSMANIVDQYASGAPTIYTYRDGELDPRDSITALNFNVDYVADRILIDRRQAWNDCMTLLGIDNSNQDKRERLVRAEISGNDDQIDNSRLVELSPRREWAKRVNALYGTEIEVNWTNDYPSRNHILDNDTLLQANTDDMASDVGVGKRINTDVGERNRG